MRIIYAFDRHDFFGTYRDWSTYDTHIWVMLGVGRVDLILNVMSWLDAIFLAKHL